MAPGGTSPDFKPRNGRDFAVSAWKVAIPVLVAAALTVSGWTLRTATAQGERLAVVETKATAAKEAADLFRGDMKEVLTGLKVELKALREARNMPSTKPRRYR